MHKRAAMVVTLVLFFSLLLLPMPRANVQPKTIVVPDDFQTITAAIGNATDGDTILVRSGTYEGPANNTL